MKTIGIIGGMSWESTIEYYRIMNQEIQKRLGGVKSARIMIDSYDFDEIVVLQKAGNWDKLAAILTNSAKKMESAGADMILIATNTMHKIAPYISDAIDIPLLHIVDTTSSEILKRGYNKIGLLGTKYTMSHEFYRNHLMEHYSIISITPEEDEQNIVHNIIFDELCAGKILEQSKEKLKIIIESLKDKGAQAVVLGCTELPNIIKEAPLPIVDTMEVHAKAAIEEALKSEPAIFI